MVISNSSYSGASVMVSEGLNISSHFSFNQTQNTIKCKITRKLLCELSIVKGDVHDVSGASSILACIRYD